MLVFEYQHGICGILLCREFRFVFLNPFVLGIGNCSRIFAFRAAEQTSIGVLTPMGRDRRGLSYGGNRQSHRRRDGSHRGGESEAERRTAEELCFAGSG